MNSSQPKKILKVFGWILGIPLILLLILEIIFIIYQDDIERELITFVNESQNGEIIISSISFSPLSHFPDISLRLNDVQYFETKSNLRKPEEKAFCHLKKFYISLDVIDLLGGDLDVSELTLEEGTLYIATQEDGSNNLTNLFSMPDDSKEYHQKDENGKTANLQLNKFTLEDIRLTYENNISEYRADIFITNFENHLTFVDKQLDIKLQPQIEIISIGKKQRTFLENTELQMLINFKLDLDSLRGHIDKSWINIEGVNINFEGLFKIKEEYYLDLNFTSAMNDPSLLYFIFDDDIIEQNIQNISTGRIYFDGSIRGNIGENMPFIEISFGVNSLHLKIPDTERELKNFNFDGFLSTGYNPDLSDASIKIKNIHSEGSVVISTGFIDIQNFKQPEIKLDLDVNIDLRGIERIFRFVNTPIYSGVAKVKGDVYAVYDMTEKKIIQQRGDVEVEFENLSFLIANTGQKCDNLKGKIKWRDNKFRVENLALNAPPSDFLLNVEITNLFSYLLGFDSEISTNINLQAESLDFNTFFTNEDVGQWILDEFCRDVHVDIEYITDSKKLRQDSELPPGLVNIRNLKIDLKNVSNVAIRQGAVTIKPDLLEIRNIRAKIADNDILFSSEIDNYKDLFRNYFLDSCKISLNLRSNKIRLKDFSTYKNENYLPEFWEEASYKVFNLDASLVLPQEPDSGRTSEYEFNLDVRNLSGVNPRNEAIIRNLSANVQDTGSDLIFHNILGQIGQTKIKNTNLDLINLFQDDSVFYIKLDLDCNYLDIEEWLGYVLDIDADSSASTDLQDSQTDTYDITHIPALDIKAYVDDFRYGDIKILNLETNIFTEKENKLYRDTRDSTWWIPDLSLLAQIDSDGFKTPYFNIPSTKNKLISKNGVLEILPNYQGMFGAEGAGHIWLDMSKKRHSYRLQYSINNFKLETFLSRFDQKQRMSGIVQMSMDLFLKDEDLTKFNGDLLLRGKDITVHNIDIDEVLTRFQRTQSFNLVDLSAFLLAGPAGALVTKASDYAILLNVDPTKQSTIKEFMSAWKVNGGVVMAEDVALTTSKSRIALKGGVDLYKEEFVEFTLGVVDKNGCPLISQTITGSLSDPQLAQINAASTILAPVTNVFKLIAGVDCNPFYTGSLSHPTN